jgi:hypothetical protein
LILFEFFHGCGFYSCDRALQSGNLDLAQRLMVDHDASEQAKYVAMAVNNGDMAFLRWMLANGAAIDSSSAIQLAPKRRSAQYSPRPIGFDLCEKL